MDVNLQHKTHALTQQIDQVIDFSGSEVSNGNKVERVCFDFRGVLTRLDVAVIVEGQLIIVLNCCELFVCHYF